MTAGVLLVGTLILSAVTFTVVGLLLLLGVIEFGVCAFMLTLTRNKNSEFGKLLSGFDRFGDACLTGILKYVYTFLWGIAVRHSRLCEKLFLFDDDVYHAGPPGA